MLYDKDILNEIKSSEIKRMSNGKFCLFYNDKFTKDFVVVGTFFYIGPKYNGIRLVQKEQGGIYYFINEKGDVIGENFITMSPEFHGFRVGQNEKDGLFYLVNRAGNTIGGYETLSTMENGPALAEGKGRKESFYVFPNGDTSKKYRLAVEFSDGYGLFFDDKTEYGFLTLNNNELKSKFPFADSFSCGYALVKTDENGMFKFLNITGKLEQREYINATGYFNGFAYVQLEENGKKFHLDMLGNLSEGKTVIGEKIFDYYSGAITLEQLVNDTDFPYDKKFERFARNLENHRLKQQRILARKFDKQQFDDEQARKDLDIYLNYCMNIYKEKNISRSNRRSLMVRWAKLNVLLFLRRKLWMTLNFCEIIQIN